MYRHDVRNRKQRPPQLTFVLKCYSFQHFPTIFPDDGFRVSIKTRRGGQYVRFVLWTQWRQTSLKDISKELCTPSTYRIRIVTFKGCPTC